MEIEVRYWDEVQERPVQMLLSPLKESKLCCAAQAGIPFCPLWPQQSPAHSRHCTGGVPGAATAGHHLPGTQHTSSAFCNNRVAPLACPSCPVAQDRMNMSSFTSKDNNLRGAKSFLSQEIESYSNSTKIMGAEEMHIIRAQQTENGLGEPDQWLHLVQLKKRRACLFSNLGLHNIILTPWDYHNQAFFKDCILSTLYQWFQFKSEFTIWFLFIGSHSIFEKKSSLFQK